MLFGCVATNDDVRGLYARQIRLEAKTEQLSQDLQALKRETQSSNNALTNDEIIRIQKQLKGMQESYTELRNRVDELTRKETASVYSPSSTVPRVESGITTNVTESETSMYTDAYNDLSQGRYKDAREQFKQFASKYPNSSKAPEAQYWIAESFYREGNFEESILEFQGFIEANPKDSKVPLAYLKQGLSLVNIGRKEEARIFLQTLIDKYPQSEEAKVAQQKLKELAGKR
ncbi:MAG TPA: tol-pal system protein YbgF [Thermodesulfobacteriota bacterium]|jgi:tol-pal system protein YbgF